MEKVNGPFQESKKRKEVRQTDHVCVNCSSPYVGGEPWVYCDGQNGAWLCGDCL